MAASGRTGPSTASLAAPRPAFGNSRGRAVIGRPGLGDLPGREVSWSFAPEELRALRDPAFETRAPEPEGERACLEPSPRLLGLYLTSSTGTPVVRVERPGISEDPASVSAVLGVVADLVRDAFSPGGARPEGGVLRAASGTRGFCGVRNRGFGLVAAIDGRETEAFLSELRRLASQLETSLGEQPLSWEGDPDALRSAEAGLRGFLNGTPHGGAQRSGERDPARPCEGIRTDPTLGGPEVGRPFEGSSRDARHAGDEPRRLGRRDARPGQRPPFSDPDVPEHPFVLSSGAPFVSDEARPYLQGWTVAGSTAGQVGSGQAGAAGPPGGGASAERAPSPGGHEAAGGSEARPPRVLALYLIAPTGMPAARVEREGLSDDPDAVGMMVNVVVDYVRDALSNRGASVERGILRAACGARGFCALPSRSFGLVAAIEGSETEAFLADLGRLAAGLEQSVGETLRSWDGNLDAMKGAQAGLRNFLFCGKFEGPEPCRVGGGPAVLAPSVAWATDLVNPVFSPVAADGGMSYSRSLSTEELGGVRGLWFGLSSAFPSSFAPPATPERSGGLPEPAQGLWGSWSLSVDTRSCGDQRKGAPGRIRKGPHPKTAPSFQPLSDALQYSTGGAFCRLARPRRAAGSGGHPLAGRPRPSAAPPRARAWGTARARRSRTGGRFRNRPGAPFANARERPRQAGMVGEERFGGVSRRKGDHLSRSPRALGSRRRSGF